MAKGDFYDTPLDKKKKKRPKNHPITLINTPSICIMTLYNVVKINRKTDRAIQLVLTHSSATRERNGKQIFENINRYFLTCVQVYYIIIGKN